MDWSHYTVSSHASGPWAYSVPAASQSPCMMKPPGHRMACQAAFPNVVQELEIVSLGSNGSEHFKPIHITSDDVWQRFDDLQALNSAGSVVVPTAVRLAPGLDDLVADQPEDCSPDFRTFSMGLQQKFKATFQG
jgi:hypothetical protein